MWKLYTNVNNIISDRIENDFGLPQGSVLGDLLYIIYIKDIERVLEKSEIVLYADDTLIFTEAMTKEFCYENIDKDINNINKWLKINKPKLNENKTTLMDIIWILTNYSR